MGVRFSPEAKDLIKPKLNSKFNKRTVPGGAWRSLAAPSLRDIIRSKLLFLKSKPPPFFLKKVWSLDIRPQAWNV
jgi:hypothetical protein